MHGRKSQCGFSLIEMMIVIVVISILSMVAIPAYQESIRKGKRADAAATLTAAAQWMERNFSDTARYDQMPSGAATTLPADLATVPSGASGNQRYYDISIDAAGQTTFTLRATPVNSMAGDACGTFTLTHAGVRGLSGNSKPVTDCWRR